MKIIEFLELGSENESNIIEKLTARLLINDIVYTATIITKSLDLIVEPANLSNDLNEQVFKIMQDALIKRGFIVARKNKYKKMFEEL